MNTLDISNWEKNQNIIVWLHKNTPIQIRQVHKITYKEDNVYKEHTFICHDITLVKKICCPICKLVQFINNSVSLSSEFLLDVEITSDKEYVICLVVDNNHFDKVLYIAEKNLGDKIIQAISNRIEFAGTSGDPTKNPQAFMFEYDEDLKKYFVTYPYKEAVLTSQLQKTLDEPIVDLSECLACEDLDTAKNIINNVVISSCSFFAGLNE